MTSTCRSLPLTGYPLFIPWTETFDSMSQFVVGWSIQVWRCSFGMHAMVRAEPSRPPSRINIHTSL
jgi:hypothetical protein